MVNLKMFMFLSKHQAKKTYHDSQDVLWKIPPVNFV